MAGAVRAVHPGLRGLLAGPIIAYDLECPPHAAHLGVPSLTATVIIAFDEPLDVGWLSSFASQQYWVSASGLHLEPALIRTHGVLRGIQLALTPQGCRALLDAPIGALAHMTASGTDIGAALSGNLHARLAELPTWPQKVAALEAHLLASRRDAPIAVDVRQAWSLLADGDSVRDTARRTGWSEKHLCTRLRAETGLRPKQISRLGRFTRARRLIHHGTAPADAAHAAGYADQAHLSREWTSLAGQSPSRERQFVFLQDLGRK